MVSIYNDVKFFYPGFVIPDSGTVDHDVEITARMFNEGVGCRVLEIGANQEPLLIALARAGYAATGIDKKRYEIVYRGSLIYINNRFGMMWHEPVGSALLNFSFIQDNFITHDFGDMKFKAVVSTSTIEHVGFEDVGIGGAKLDVEDGDCRAMDKIYDLLDDGGTAYITVPVGVWDVSIEGWRVYDEKHLQERIIRKFLVSGMLFFASAGFTYDNTFIPDGSYLSKEEAFASRGPSATVLLILKKKNTLGGA